MNTEIEYIGPKVWAKECGVYHDRAYRILKTHPIPGVLKVRTGKSFTFAIPSGTPFPEVRASDMPAGFLSVEDWAAKIGKGVGVVRYNLLHHGAPEGTIRLTGRRRYAIPEGAPWTYSGRGQHGRRPFAFGGPAHTGRKVGGRK